MRLSGPAPCQCRNGWRAIDPIVRALIDRFLAVGGDDNRVGGGKHGWSFKPRLHDHPLTRRSSTIRATGVTAERRQALAYELEAPDQNFGEGPKDPPSGGLCGVRKGRNRTKDAGFACRPTPLALWCPSRPAWSSSSRLRTHRCPPHRMRDSVWRTDVCRTVSRVGFDPIRSVAQRRAGRREPAPR